MYIMTASGWQPISFRKANGWEYSPKMDPVPKPLPWWRGALNIDADGNAKGRHSEWNKDLTARFKEICQ